MLVVDVYYLLPELDEVQVSHFFCSHFAGFDAPPLVLTPPLLFEYYPHRAPGVHDLLFLVLLLDFLQ